MFRRAAGGIRVLASISLTPHFSGVMANEDDGPNRFSGLMRRQTAKAVLLVSVGSFTPLKWGVNEKRINSESDSFACSSEYLDVFQTVILRERRGSARPFQITPGAVRLCYRERA